MRFTWSFVFDERFTKLTAEPNRMLSASLIVFNAIDR